MPRLLNLAFCAHQPLRHSGFREQKRLGDFRRAQSAERTQRQGDLGFPVERRMAAGKDQPQPIVGEGHKRFIRA